MKLYRRSYQEALESAREIVTRDPQDPRGSVAFPLLPPVGYRPRGKRSARKRGRR